MLFGKNYDNAFEFSKFIIQNIVSFPEVVHDYIVSNDATITASLCIDVIISGINLLFS